MAKRKRTTRKESILETSHRLKESVATAFRGGNLKKAFSQLEVLKLRLANRPELLDETLTEIALAITDEGAHVELRKAAFEEIQKILQQANLNHPHALAKSGEILGRFGQYKVAVEKFEQALKYAPEDIDVLNNYGGLLVESENHEKAIKKFTQVLQLKPNYIKALSNLGIALDRSGQYNAAIEKFKEVLQRTPKDSNVLTGYGAALFNLQKYSSAIRKFEQALSIHPNRPNTLFLYAVTLEKIRKFKDAISRLNQININALSQDNANLIHLSLGRLHYLDKSEQKAREYFNLAIQNSTDQDAERIKIAQEIFAMDPYSEEGIAILQDITETSPHYAQAFRSLSLNLSPKAYFQMFNTGPDANTLKDTEVLNRAMYHKIANEVSILKEIVYEIVADEGEEGGPLAAVSANIDLILAGIRQRREAEQAQVKAIPADDYDQIIGLISETAHDISDFVNNELAVLEEDLRFALEDDGGERPDEALSELLAQIKITQAALNDLKAINEGIKIKRSRFKVKELFENWARTPKLPQATITLDIQNAESLFEGDEQKIKGFLKELVENSLKHNPERSDLAIHIEAKGVTDKTGRKALRIIYSDDGRGIPSDKKQWVFLPLKTTSEVGSGLGLFIIKRTLKEMGGHIEEKGQAEGVHFEMTIPYLAELPDDEDENLTTISEETVGEPEEYLERTLVAGGR